jgi:hypothetical protein
MSALGLCKKCNHDLCISHNEVRCEKCGLPHLEHPMMLEIIAAKKAPPPAPPRDVQRDDYVSSWGDRINSLEKLTKAQAKLIEVQGKRIEHLESAGKSRKAG